MIKYDCNALTKLLKEFEEIYLGDEYFFAILYFFYEFEINRCKT